MRVPVVPLALAFAIVAIVPAAGQSSFVEWCAPWIRIDAGDLRGIRNGEVLSRVLPADGNQVGVFLAGSIDAGASTFARKVLDVEALWEGEKVPQVVKFSSPPQLDDVAALSLEAADVNAIRTCRPGDCDVKLSAPEMARLQAAVRGAAGAWRDAVQAEFRRIVLDRVRAYRSAGLRGLGPFHDQDEPLEPLAAFTHLLMRFPWMAARAPRLGEYFERYPAALPGSAETFLYWMKTTYLPKPTHLVTHVVVQRRTDAGAGPAVVVVSRQIFATHYINSSVALSAFFAADEPSRGILAYVNRSHVDGLGGWLSGLRRYFVERRVRGAAEGAFERQRERIAG